MKIDLYTFEGGSPNTLIPEDIYGRGVGGAELAMMSWAKVMVQRGHDIRIYNDPRIRGDHDGVIYLPRLEFDPFADRDVWIAFRSPNRYMGQASAPVKIHWSCDQQTAGDYASDIIPYVDLVVCISPHHRQYYSNRYNIQPPKIGYIDLGVLISDYDKAPARIENRFIFCSVPQRGLDLVHQIWPIIRASLPDATLAITSDYRLWGAPYAGDQEFRLNFATTPGVEYYGKLPRHELVRQQLKADIHLYPCTYDELFCISVAECQVAGAWPITSDMGSLLTTNEFGTAFNFPGQPVGSPRWLEAYVEAVFSTMETIGDPEREEMQRVARERFDWNIICERWERLIETGEFDHADS